MMVSCLTSLTLSNQVLLSHFCHMLPIDHPKSYTLDLLFISLLENKQTVDNSYLLKKKTTHTHTLGTGAGYCDLCVCMCFFCPREFFRVCVHLFPCPRLMRYERILPSSVAFLRVAVKVNLGTRERVHGWWRKGHVSPTCPI